MNQCQHQGASAGLPPTQRLAPMHLALRSSQQVCNLKLNMVLQVNQWQHHGASAGLPPTQRLAATHLGAGKPLTRGRNPAMSPLASRPPRRRSEIPRSRFPCGIVPASLMGSRPSTSTRSVQTLHILRNASSQALRRQCYYAAAWIYTLKCMHQQGNATVRVSLLLPTRASSCAHKQQGLARN